MITVDSEVVQQTLTMEMAALSVSTVAEVAVVMEKMVPVATAVVAMMTVSQLSHQVRSFLNQSLFVSSKVTTGSRTKTSSSFGSQPSSSPVPEITI